MSTLKVNSIEASSGSEIDINSTLGTVPSIVVSNLNVTGVVTATSFSGIVNSGVSTVAAGSAAAPSITPTGDTDTGIFFPSADTIAFGEGGSEAARIDSSGRFGLGTASPATPLHIASQYPSIRLQSNAGSYQQRSTVGQFDNIMYIECDNDNVLASSAMAFTIDGGEAVRIDSSKRLLVGTTNIGGASYNSYYSRAIIAGNTFDNTYGRLTIKTNTAAASISGTTLIGEIYFSENGGGDFAAIKCEGDGTAGTNDFPGRLTFSTTADSASSPTEAMRINNQRELLIGTITRTANGGVLQVSNGITFPATQSACSDANTLDDYEEGNWTPLIAFGGGVVGQSYSVQVGRYTKIGRLVMFQCRVTFSNKGTSTGQATLRTLPFNPSGSSNGGASLAYVGNGGANFGAASRYAVDVGSTSIVFRYASGGGSTDVANTDFNNNTDIIVIGQYIID